jgi:hypothetical protein
MTREEAEKIHPKIHTEKASSSHLLQASRREVGERGRREERDVFSFFSLSCPAPGASFVVSGMRARRVSKRVRAGIYSLPTGAGPVARGVERLSYYICSGRV